MCTIVVLKVNGEVRFRECSTSDEAHQQAEAWLELAKKNFPNKQFVPVYYIAERMSG